MEVNKGHSGKELAAQLMLAKDPRSFWEQRAASGDVRSTVSLLNSEVYRIAGVDRSAADQLVTRIERLASQKRDPALKAFAQAGRASVMNQSGRYREASVLFARAAKSLERARLPMDSAIVRKQHVGALVMLGRYREALETARLTRRTLARAEPAELAQLETNIGNAYYRLDSYSKALKHYKLAREIFEEIGDDAMTAFVDFACSNVLCEMDQPQEALALLQKAEAAWDAAGRKFRSAQARRHIAYIEFLRGRYNAALTGYYQVRDQFAALDHPEMAAWCDQEIAEVLLALNAFQEAAEFAATAQMAFTKLGMPYESAQAMIAHALSLIGLSELESARKTLRKARSIFAQRNNRILTAQVDLYLADVALRIGNSTEAARRAASSLRVFSRNKLSTKSAFARVIKARSEYRLGNFTAATRLVDNALKTVTGLFAPAVSYQSHHLKGLIERQRRRHGLSLKSLLDAVNIIEQMRGGVATDEFKASFLRDKVEIYEDAIAACLDDGTEGLLHQAFQLVESAKSRALADLLANYLRERYSEQNPNNQEFTKLSKLIEELNWYSAQATSEEDTGKQRSTESADRYRRAIRRRERKVAECFRRLEADDSTYAEIRSMTPAGVSDLRNTLEADETAIEYFSTSGQISAFIASREGIKVVRNIASNDLIEKQIAALRFQFAKFNYGPDFVDVNFSQLKRAADAQLALLYQQIFAPIETELKQKLVVIPHGLLHYVPFHALRDGDTYLLDRFEVSYAPSTTVLRLCREGRKQRKPYSDDIAGSKMVALGVTEPGIPAVTDEIESLASLFPGAVTLLGDQATRDNLLRFAPNARFLHLASHGQFRSDNPMFSYLKLVDCQLNFYNLLELKLGAELVTLSACQTGVNTISPGDELHGLMRGFLHAGAPSLVASLWAVSDRSTSELMKIMYSGIQNGNAKRAALRAAQLAIKDEYGHPYYWAPFILMGDAT